MGRVLLGTSGWSYQEWVGVFYPTSTESKLKHYTRVFPTAEIDSTFYAMPQPGVVQGWDRYSPKEFAFAAKLPKTVTHDLLEHLGHDIEKEMDKFAELMMPLNNSGKLACLLIQLPPSYKYDVEHLDQFLALLPHGYKYAIEFRHKSWLQPQTWKILSRYSVAYTIVDEPLLPPDIHVTADFAYLRWHGHGQHPWYDYHYTDKELEDWKPKIEEIQSSTKNTLGYFNNHFHGYAVENALKVLQMLGKLTQEQEEALDRAETHLGKRPSATAGLGKWLDRTRSESKIIEELTQLMGRPRVERAMAIGDNEVNIKQADSNNIQARVRNYTVTMDMRSKTILHDCGDWERSIETKQLCKHIGRLFLTIPEPLAAEWISKIRSDLQEWNFGKAEKSRAPNEQP